jgi:BioD-like phosphotransacetylase family protein
VGRLTEEARAQKEAAIRATMERLLRGEIPPGGKCDVKTLAAASGVTRAALYTTYLPLKEEFERRRDQLRDAGVIADPRDAQIDRLKQQVHQLKQRLSAKEQQNTELTAFRIQALSRLAAQHEEVIRLRAVTASADNVHTLSAAHHRAPAET